MISWLLVIVAMAVFQVLAIRFDFPENYVYASTILVLIAALGLIYRANHHIKDKEQK